jgi:hypothetical protein
MIPRRKIRTLWKSLTKGCMKTGLAPPLKGVAEPDTADVGIE